MSVTSRRASFEIQPQVRARVIGPGRVEQRYQRELAELLQARVRAEAELRSAQEQARAAQGHVVLLERIERGSARRMDRLEGRLERERERCARAEQDHKRLAALVGALQRENELLRERVEQLGAAPRPQLAARRRTWWSRWLGR